MAIPNFMDEKTENLFLSHCIRKHYKKNEVIIRAGDRSDRLFYIVRGSVMVIVESPEGEQMIVANLSRGEFIGEMGLFYSNYTRTAWVIAHSECDIAITNYGKFRQLVENNVEVLYAVGRQLVYRLQTTTQKVSDFAFHDVAERIARTLVYLSRNADRVTDNARVIRFTKQEISRMVGCSREVAGRAMKLLEEKGFIKIDGKTIYVSQAAYDKLHEQTSEAIG